MSLIPPRPEWNHTAVRDAAVSEIEALVREWVAEQGIADDTTGKDFTALLTLALRETPDAYACGRYIEDFIGWPVDGVLIRILDNAYRRLPGIAREMVPTWVMKNAIRFPAKKGEWVVFRTESGDVKGEVTELIGHEARALVQTRDGPVTVFAENVIETLCEKRRPTRRTRRKT